MPTRRASNPTKLHQHRYFSARDFVEQEPLNGVAVSHRAALLEDARCRRLIWFVQRKSIEPGLPVFAAQILAAFPERLGTPSIHQRKVRADGTYEAELETIVRRELGDEFARQSHRIARMAAARRRVNQMIENGDVESNDEEQGRRPSVSGQSLLDLCEREAALLPQHLAELCLDPKFSILPPGGNSREPERMPTPAGYFDDLVGALYILMDQQGTEAREDFAMTSIAKIVWAQLDLCQKSRRSAMLTGKTGIGKSEAIMA